MADQLAPPSLSSPFRQLRQLYARSKRDKDELHERWRNFYRAVFEPVNNQWTTRLPVTTTLSRPRVNEIWPIVSSLTGFLTDQRPTLQVSPGVSNRESQLFTAASTLTEDLQNVLEYVLRMGKFELELEKQFWDTLTYGTGFLKAVYDPDADSGAGQAVVRRVDPWMMYVDPLADSGETATFWMERRVLSRWQAAQFYGNEAADLPPGDIDSFQRPSTTERSNLGRPPMALAGNIEMQPTIWPNSATEVPSDWGADDIVTVIDAWWLDDGGWFYCPFGADRTLFAPRPATDLYEHGRHPYSRYVMQETGEFWGPSLVEYLMSPQSTFNDLLFHGVNNVRLGGDPIWLEDERAGTDRQRLVARPGHRVKKQPGGEVGWLNPPDLPAATIPLLQMFVTEMERISGLGGASRGQTPTAGRPSQGTVEAAQESGLIRVRSALRNLEYQLAEVGNLLASIVTREYTGARMLEIIGPEGLPSILQLSEKHFYSSHALAQLQPADADPSADPLARLSPRALEDTPLKFAVWVEAGSSLPASQDRRASQAMAMFQMGALDLEGLYRVLKLPGWQQTLARINAAKAAGTFTPPAARGRPR